MKSGIIYFIIFVLALLLCQPDVIAQVTYTVKKGDTLSTIAERELASAERWPEIAELNKINPQDLKIGQVIKLPSPFALYEDKDVQPDPQLEREFADDDEHAPNLISEFVEKVKSIPVYWWIIAGLAGIVLWIIIYTINLRVACWLAVVETTLGKCFKLSIWLSVISMIVVAIAFFVYWNDNIFESEITADIIANAGMLLGFIVGLIITKSVLQCKWRNTIIIHFGVTFLTFVFFALVAIAAAIVIPNILH